MFLLHAFVANRSISPDSTTPLTSSSPIASTTAFPTDSTFIGFSPPAPISHDSLPPSASFTMLPAIAAAAMGRVNDRLASYMNDGRTKTGRSEGNSRAMVASASRLVER